MNTAWDVGEKRRQSTFLRQKKTFWRRQYCKPTERLERYTRKNHNIIFDGWWSCSGSHAKGSGLNKRSCTNPIERTSDNDEHRDTRRRINADTDNQDDDYERHTGTIANKQARKRAEELQKDENEQKTKY